MRERQLRAVVEFAAGKLAVRPGPGNRRYGLVLQYDAGRFQPLGSYNPATAEVRLGVTGRGSGGIRVNRSSALPRVAAEDTLELRGLKLSALELKSGASRTTVSFATPNAGNCRTARITSGAGELSITGAGISGCRSWRLESGVGEVAVGLDGAWPADARMTLNLALGGVTLRAPKALGPEVSMSGFMAGFNPPGFTKTGNTYTSANYAQAARHLDVELSSALGGVSVVWR